MKIGILTFHRAHNYGAVLQCYALQQFLTQLGHSVFVIDYNNKNLWSYYGWRDREYEKAMKKNIIKFPIRLLIYLLNRRKQIIRYYKFENFQEHVLKLANVNSIEKTPYDLILIGSDQVWNTSITKGFDAYYWGTFERPLTTKVATYAASLKSFWKEEQYKKIYELLKKLDGISVREVSLGRFVNKLFPDLCIKCVPDPVFLLSPDQWKKLAKFPKIDSEYVFFYQAGNSDFAYKTAKEIASQKKIPMFSLSANQWTENSKECHSASPQEFLGWILNAKLVITSSFHALAFCILFQKDFYAINLNQGHDDRLKNIVNLFGVEDRLIDDASQCRPLKPFFNHQETLNKLQNIAKDYITQLM